MENGRIDCANKEKIEWACIKENQRRFAQVHDPPPMKQEILEWIGTCAENESAEGILNGTEDLSHIEDIYLRLLLENMRRLNSVIAHGLIPTEITLKEHRNGWRKKNKNQF